ncbi:MAG: NUDIX domain-containing protein, partial [Polyangiaceae bacterium]
METVRIAIGLIWNAGELLIARRNPGTRQALKWEFPGGKIESEESAGTAVVREVLEETGLRVQLLGERQRILHTYPDHRVEIHVFDCRADSREAAPLSSQEVRWVP